MSKHDIHEIRKIHQEILAYLQKTGRREMPIGNIINILKPLVDARQISEIEDEWLAERVTELETKGYIECETIYNKILNGKNLEAAIRERYTIMMRIKDDGSDYLLTLQNSSFK